LRREASAVHLDTLAAIERLAGFTPSRGSNARPIG
jgi:hypothetical protein